MTTDPVFRDWTAKAVEHRVLEAAETLMLCPRALGPKQFGSSMPEPLRQQRDAYAAQKARYRRRPDAAAIDRMEECWEWINALADRHDRHLIYDWARAKRARGRSLKGLADREGVSDRTLRREITRICSAMAERLNGVNKPNLGGRPCGDTMQRDNSATVERHQAHWRASNGKPRIDPHLKKTRLL